MTEDQSTIDSILLVSFGGPEGPEDVIPFLENVLRGKPVPKERMLEVAEHYYHFGGKSPINEQNRDIIVRLQEALTVANLNLPVYWGNRNWKPFIADALRQIHLDGYRMTLPIFTNMFSCYSGCRQYRENLRDAHDSLGDDSPTLAPRLRFGFNHPRFIAAQVDLTRQALQAIGEDQRSGATIVFTAHSIPMTMADNCNYVLQLRESAQLISQELGFERWEVVFQSRSGPPQQPWLEPDICDRIRELAAEGMRAAVVVPLGFVSDHMEVMFDLDTEAKQVCQELGVGYTRAPAASAHPEFIAMLVDLIQERLTNRAERVCVGNLPPLHDVCPTNCCLYPQPTRPPSRTGQSD